MSLSGKMRQVYRTARPGPARARALFPLSFHLDIKIESQFWEKGELGATKRQPENMGKSRKSGKTVHTRERGQLRTNRKSASDFDRQLIDLTH